MSFPGYRIPVIIGWILPPLLSLLIVWESPLHIVLKIVAFFVLTLGIFFFEVLLALKIGGIWNRRQRGKEEKASGKLEEDD